MFLRPFESKGFYYAKNVRNQTNRPVGSDGGAIVRAYIYRNTAFYRLFQTGFFLRGNNDSGVYVRSALRGSDYFVRGMPLPYKEFVYGGG